MSEKIYGNFEDELDAIRLSLYDEVKDMNTNDMIAYLQKQTAPIIKKLGLEYSTLKPVQPRKRERTAF